jgi:uncharacterized membrane protein YkvA (DUF1232 family)
VPNQKSDVPSGPAPWGADPIKGLDYSYLDIDEPPAVSPAPVMPTRVGTFNPQQAEDFYKRLRGKITAWAEHAGANKETTGYILILPDIMALFIRLMADPRVSPALKAEIAAASAYVIIPVDLLPELVLGPAGLIDDVIVAMIALNRVVKAMGQVGEDVLLEHWDGDEDILKVIQDILNKADQFVSGTVWNGIKSFMQEPSDVVQGQARPTSQPPDK